MKKLGRRTLAIIAGLILGWTCAGYLGDYAPAILPQAHAAAPAGEDNHGDHHEPDLGQEAAGQLVPKAEDITFYEPVVATAVGLFALAIVVGIVARVSGIKDPGVAAAEADAAAAHHDHHDDHAHDSHGHAHH